MTKRRLASYGLNLVGVALLYALITLAFTFNVFGKSTTYIQGICTTACYTIIMVTSLNLVVGFMGEFSMGHAGFVSVGAYVSAIVSGALAGRGLSDLGLLLVAILAGGLAAGIMGVAVGIPALRLRGDYLAIVTMAFAEIIRVCFCNFSITGGGKTMSGILKLSTFDRAFWIMVVCVTIMFLFVRSRFGRTVQAIREDYIAASASGINVTYYKVLTFAISAFFAGIAGVLYSYCNFRVDSANFDYNYSIEILVMVVLGGMGSINGSIIAATLITFLNLRLQTVLTGNLSVLKNIVYALILILLVIYNNAPALKGFREKYSLRRLIDRRLRHRKDPAFVREDEASWERIPTKINMDELLSVDLRPTDDPAGDTRDGSGHPDGGGEEE